LKNAVEKFQNNRNAIFGFNQQFDLFKQFMSNTNAVEYKERFAVKVGAQIKIILRSEIVCFYSENKATYIQTTEGRSYIVDYTLEELEKMVDPVDFFRVNRKFIVSIKAIKDIYTYSNSRLKLNLINLESEDLIVSREKVNDFKKWIEK